MKKLLTFALVAIMLLTTFTGCNVTLDDVIYVMDLLTPTVPQTTEPEATEAPTDPNAPVRTTVTKEEFLASMESVNFTISASTISSDGTTQSTLYRITDSAIYALLPAPAGDEVQETEAFLIMAHHTLYAIRKEASGYVAYASGNNDFRPGLTLGYLLGARSVGYDSFVYNEETGTYTYDGDTYNGTYEYRFENGKLKSFSTQGGTMYISDIGTTVVDVPEYTIDKNESIRTTATAEEWLAAMELANYSSISQTISADNIQRAQSTIGVANSTITNDLTGSTYTSNRMYQYERILSESDISESRFYFTSSFVNGELSSQYQIREEGDGYVAYPYNEKLEYPTLGDLFGDIAYSDLVYNEKTMSYKYETEEFTFEIGFEDGSVVGIIHTLRSEGTTTVSRFLDVGETSFRVPDYTYAPTDSQ